MVVARFSDLTVMNASTASGEKVTVCRMVFTWLVCQIKKSNL